MDSRRGAGGSLSRAVLPGRMDGMKVHLSQISEEGWRETLRIPASSLVRLCEAHGPQQGMVEAEISLRQRGGNVEVKGRFQVSLRVPCQRCLDPVPFQLEEALEVTMAPDSPQGGMEEETRLSAGDLEISFFQGEEIDLDQVLEDEIFLLLPENLCDEDERGRCYQCGKDVEALLKRGEENRDDHPFAGLKDLLR